jgi:peptidoglycan/xylan/chitin deacetylase (PgdA/CDA1 family)
VNILVVFYTKEITHILTNVNNVVQELKTRNHNVLYITDIETTNNNHIINFNNKSLLLALRNYCFLIYLIKKHKVQVIHSISYSQNLICKIISKITNTSIINTCYINTNTKDNIFLIDNLETIYQTTYVTHIKREIPIIMYHRFIKHNNEKGKSCIYLDIKKLENQFKFLKKQGFETITFADLNDKGLISRLEYGKKFIIITIDDGYEDNYHLLFPLLKKYNFKAVIYMVTGVNYNKWDVDSIQESKFPLMNNSQLIEMVNSGLVEIGGHTLTHPDLRQLANEQLQQEISFNKLQIEKIINKNIISFSYPYGLTNKKTKHVIKKNGYKFAVSVCIGPSNISDDRYQIQRIEIKNSDNILLFWLKTTGYYNYLLHRFRLIKKFIFKSKPIYYFKGIK